MEVNLKVAQRHPSTSLGMTSIGTRLFLALIALFASVICAHAAEILPQKPDRYFNDYAHVVSPEAALRFNEQLAQFERDTSNQVVVAVFSKMETDSSIEDYTQRIAQSWGVGQKDRRNGAALFVFIQDRKMFIQVGYGLEGALPDITAFAITERHIKPHFKTGDYEGGLATGIDLICKAIRGEYKGSGKTNADQTTSPVSPGTIIFLIIAFIFIMKMIFGRRRRRGYGFSGRGGPFIGGFGGGGGWSGGSSSGGGFSGFSGGGGSFGGGGAGSSW